MHVPSARGRRGVCVATGGLAFAISGRRQRRLAWRWRVARARYLVEVGRKTANRDPANQLHPNLGQNSCGQNVLGPNHRYDFGPALNPESKVETT